MWENRIIETGEGLFAVDESDFLADAGCIYFSRNAYARGLSKYAARFPRKQLVTVYHCDGTAACVEFDVCVVGLCTRTVETGETSRTFYEYLEFFPRTTANRR